MRFRRDGRAADQPVERAGEARRGLLIGCCLLASALGVDACASTGTVRLEALAPPGTGRAWPSPPDRARVRFLASFSTPEDLGFRRSLLGRVFRFIRGSDGSEGIRHPYGVAVTPDERVYVVDSSARGVHRFDLLRGRYDFLTHDDLRQPIGVAARSADTLYVSDPKVGMVLVLDGDGDEIGRLSEGLVRPTGLAFDAVRSRLYVVDTGRHLVTVFDGDGSVVSTFGGRGTAEGRLNYPTNVAVDGSGRVYVTDSMNFRVQVFDFDGRHVDTFGGVGDGLGQFARPKGIGVDAAGHVLVVEGLYDVVNIFDAAGRLLLTFGGPGTGEGAFWLATGLAVDGRNRIFVADSYNGRVQVFQLLSAEAP